MNIKERQSMMINISELARFGGIKTNNIIIGYKELLNKWNNMSKPPLTYYIPYNVIREIEEITSSVKYMNKPAKKMELVNNILAPYGFKPLASGTNRRSFYCEYDPSIIVKLGSDIVGREDNKSEFVLQHTLKPYVPKIYDIFPSGVLCLEERVEPLTEKEFKLNHSKFVFDCIFFILSKGYIMEDVGTNFFKNWGVRMNGGPVILDFPYLYEVDYNKLKCDFVDSNGIRCNGYLDYNYDTGMNEIICLKCGRRYSAKSLAKVRTKDELKFQSAQKGVKYDTMIDTDIKTRVEVDGKIICFCNETNNKLNLNTKNQSIEQEKPKTQYNKEVKNQIIKFLVNIERQFGEETSLDLAEKLGIKYFTLKEQEEKRNKYKEKQQIKIDKNKLEKIEKPLTASQILKEENSFINSYENNLDCLESLKNEEKNNDDMIIDIEKEEDEEENQDSILAKPMSPEELMKMTSVNSEKEIMGIPGQSVADINLRQMDFDKLKQNIIEYYDDNPIKLEIDKDKQIQNEIIPVIRELSKETIQKQFNETDNMVINVEFGQNYTGKQCYTVTIKYLSTLVAQIELFPTENSVNQINFSKPERDKESVMYKLSHNQDLIKQNQIQLDAEYKEIKEDNLSNDVPLKDTAIKDTKNIETDDPALSYMNIAINDFVLKNFDKNKLSDRNNLISFLASKYQDVEPDKPFPIIINKATEYVNLRFGKLNNKVSDEI